MSLLGPVLFAALIIVPTWLMNIDDNEIKIIGVVEYDEFNQPVPDSLMIIKGAIPEHENLKIEYLSSVHVEDLIKNIDESPYYAIVKVPNNIPKLHNIFIYSNKQPQFGITNHIENSIEDYWFRLKLRKHNVSVDAINNARVNINVNTIKVTDKGEVKTSVETSMITGYVSGLLIYMLIFIFGIQVMRGIIEEKTNRIVEVMVSSLKPLQLMLGKIFGIALVGLTQFVLWIALSLMIVQGFESYLYQQKVPEASEIKAESLFNADLNSQPEAMAPALKQQTNTSQIEQVLAKVKSLNYFKILTSFFFYFIFGYLLYAALFAAIGSAVDSDTDAQQFMMPVTIPLILAILTMGNVINNPEGPVAFWFSMIPFTSPIVMMVRIPFEIPTWQIIVSVFLLMLTFLLMTWLAAKIYRTGILMYGKKPSFKEIFKWLKYK